MVRLVLEYKYLLTLCIILMLCPRRTRLSLQDRKVRQGYETPQDDWNIKAPSIVQIEDRDDIERVNEAKPAIDEEPGFDLTKEEIIKFKIWPQGVIPYYIDVFSFSDKVLRDRIRSFLNTVNSITSLNFLELPSPPEDTESRWVFFVNRRGLLKCADHSIKNFTNQGVQQVVLGYDCISTGNELSEAVLAIAGVPSQHNAPDRDDYIQIVEENIIPEKKYLFEKLKDNEWLFHDVDYDFKSAGHYHFHKYSVNGRATIEAKKTFANEVIGETKGLSVNDVQKIKMLYNYLTRKRQLNVPECHQLFEPSSDFNTYEPESDNKKPRKKPNKYLGLQDGFDGDQNEEPIQDKENTENSNVGHSNVNADKEHKVLKYQWDPISLLSDYQTGDERLSHTKKRPGTYERPRPKDKNSQKQTLLFKKIGT